jgi:aminoglycoside 2'-N-acetyltransferase I
VFTPDLVGAVTVRRFTTAAASERLLAEIRGVLDQAFGGEFTDEDWRHTLGGWHVVAEEEDAVVAHAAVVERVLHLGDRPVRAGYVEGVATVPDRQRQGLGSRVMLEVAAIVREDFDIGALSTEEAGFYARLGWELWRGPTSVRHGADLVRTEDEDGGVMVLRFGPTASADLDDPISCPSRPGDDW